MSKKIQRGQTPTNDSPGDINRQKKLGLFSTQDTQRTKQEILESLQETATPTPTQYRYTGRAQRDIESKFADIQYQLRAPNQEQFVHTGFSADEITIHLDARKRNFQEEKNPNLKDFFQKLETLANSPAASRLGKTDALKRLKNFIRLYFEYQKMRRESHQKSNKSKQDLIKQLNLFEQTEDTDKKAQLSQAIRRSWLEMRTKDIGDYNQSEKWFREANQFCLKLGGADLEEYLTAVQKLFDTLREEENSAMTQEKDLEDSALIEQIMTRFDSNDQESTNTEDVDTKINRTMKISNMELLFYKNLQKTFLNLGIRLKARKNDIEGDAQFFEIGLLGKKTTTTINPETGMQLHRYLPLDTPFEMMTIEGSDLFINQLSSCYEAQGYSAGNQVAKSFFEQVWNGQEIPQNMISSNPDYLPYFLQSSYPSNLSPAQYSEHFEAKRLNQFRYHTELTMLLDACTDATSDDQEEKHTMQNYIHMNIFLKTLLEESSVKDLLQGWFSKIDQVEDLDKIKSYAFKKMCESIMTSYTHLRNLAESNNPYEYLEYALSGVIMPSRSHSEGNSFHFGEVLMIKALSEELFNVSDLQDIDWNSLLEVNYSGFKVNSKPQEGYNLAYPSGTQNEKEAPNQSLAKLRQLWYEKFFDKRLDGDKGYNGFFERNSNHLKEISQRAYKKVFKQNGFQNMFNSLWKDLKKEGKAPQWFKHKG